MVAAPVVRCPCPPLPADNVPISPSLRIGPNVAPLSLLILSTDSLVLFAGLVLVSHQLTYTLSSCATISAFCESASVELLRFILSSNVSLVSLEALNITSQFPDLLVHHTIIDCHLTLP